MDIGNPVIQLCLEGTRAEFEHKKEEARAFYQQAWNIHTDDYEACIAAHYLARFQKTAEDTLQWNLTAVEHAIAVTDFFLNNGESVESFLPSLYLNLGHSYETLGNNAEAQKYYQLAATLGVIHQADNIPQSNFENQKS